MDSVTLNIRRDGSLAGAAVPYYIFINGMEVGALAVGKKLAVQIPADKKSILVASQGKNTLMPHQIKGQVILHPEYCEKAEINCIIKTRFKIAGLASFGWLQPIGETEITVDYK